MRRRSAVVAAWPARAVRGLWPDRNPLRRTVDRVEAVVVGALAVAFLAGAPLAAVAAGHFSYAIISRTARAQQTAWHQVPAVPLTGIPADGYGFVAMVRARWTSPDGTRRTGMVPAPPVAQAGGTVRVWVDAAAQADRAAGAAFAGAGPGGADRHTCPRRCRLGLAVRRPAGPQRAAAGGGWPPGTRTGRQPGHSGPGGAESLSGGFVLPAAPRQPNRVPMP